MLAAEQVDDPRGPDAATERGFCFVLHLADDRGRFSQWMPAHQFQRPLRMFRIDEGHVPALVRYVDWVKSQKR